MCTASGWGTAPNFTQIATAGLMGGKNPGDMGFIPGPVTLSKSLVNDFSKKNTVDTPAPTVTTYNSSDPTALPKNSTPETNPMLPTTQQQIASSADPAAASGSIRLYRSQRQDGQ